MVEDGARPPDVDRLEPAVRYLADRQATLWAYAVLLFAVGDVVTSVVGLRFASVIEAGPLAAVLLAEYGVRILVPLKAGTVGVAAVLWWLTPRPHDVGVPLGLAALGAVATLWNALVVGAALL